MPAPQPHAQHPPSAVTQQTTPGAQPNVAGKIHAGGAIGGAPAIVPSGHAQAQPPCEQSTNQGSSTQMPSQTGHPNLFQQAVLQQAAAVGTTASHQVPPTPSGHPTAEEARFAALQHLSSSDASTTSGSSSSSGEGRSSGSGTDVPFRPTYQSTGPHHNIPFDL